LRRSYLVAAEAFQFGDQNPIAGDDAADAALDFHPHMHGLAVALQFDPQTVEGAAVDGVGVSAGQADGGEVREFVLVLVADAALEEQLGAEGVVGEGGGGVAADEGVGVGGEAMQGGGGRAGEEFIAV
jgi:hypothetical protein